MPLPVVMRNCRNCMHWARSYTGPQTWGFCCWRENADRHHQPRMNLDTHFRLHEDGTLLETRGDASCLQFEPKAK